MTTIFRKWLFYAAAAYDAVLGVVFVFFWRQLFSLFEVTPPNHGGYVLFTKNGRRFHRPFPSP